MKNQMLHGGLPKLTEELGELSQVVGKKLNLDKSEWIYWDGQDLKSRLEEEMGDVWAAIVFVCDHFGLDFHAVQCRRAIKLRLYKEWDSG